VEFVIVLAVVAMVVFVVTGPLRRPVPSPALDREEVDAITEAAELEAEREAKYREIRDAELDHRTGKLSDQDYAAIDQSLRAEAIEILNAIDRSKPSGAPPAGPE
jgi:hypothetical protein